MRQTTHERSRQGLGLLVALAVGVGLTGCGLVSSGDGAAAPLAVSSPEPIPPRTLVNLASLSNVDVNGPFVVVSRKNGTKVKGTRTLDYCGAAFSTEKHRVARRQVVVNLTNGSYAGMSNEVVAYDSEAQATTALAELRAAVDGCSSKTWITTKTQPTYRVTVGTEGTSKMLPIPDNAVVRAELVTKQEHRRLYLLQVYQRHGVVLDIFYAESTKPFTKNQVRIVMSGAQLVGGRLAAT